MSNSLWKFCSNWKNMIGFYFIKRFTLQTKLICIIRTGWVWFQWISWTLTRQHKQTTTPMPSSSGCKILIGAQKICDINFVSHTHFKPVERPQEKKNLSCEITKTGPRLAENTTSLRVKWRLREREKRGGFQSL